MSKPMSSPKESLQWLAEGDLTLLNVLKRMTEGTFEGSGLDPRTFMLVRIAALAALDAAPASWLLNMEASGEAGLAPESILGTFVAIAPIIGTAGIVSSAGTIVKTFELIEDSE